MQLVFDEPWWLLLASLMVAPGIFLLRRRVGGWAVLFPLLAAVFAAMALARPVAMTRQGPVILLLDLSASTEAAPWRSPDWVRRQAAAHLATGQTLTIVGFDRQPEILARNLAANVPDNWPDRWPATGNAPVTNLEAALAWSDVDSGEAPRWIFSDGLAAAPATAPRFPLAATIVPPDRVDAGVREVQIRAFSAPAPGVEVLAQIRVTGPSVAGQTWRGAVQMKRDGTLAGETTVVFTASSDCLDVSQWVSFREPFDGKPHGYEVIIVPEGGGDPWPRNDRGAAYFAGSAARRVLVVGAGRTAANGDPLSRLLGQEGVTFVTPARFAPTAADLARETWQSIVLDDVPVFPAVENALSPAAASALKAFVESTGGGLLIVGRGHAFGPGGYDRLPDGILEGLSPVSSHPPLAQGRVMFLLDDSASMGEAAAGGGAAGSKFRVLTDAVLQAVRQLPTGQRATVIAFNGEAHTLYDGPAAELAQQAGKLAGLRPQGPTQPDCLIPQVRQAAEQSAGGDSLELIFVTDGEIPAVNAAGWREAIDAGVGRAHLTIIAPAASGDSKLAQLAGATRAVWLKTEDAGRWPEVVSGTLHDLFAGGLHESPLAWQSVDAPALKGETPSWTQVWLKPEARLVAQGTSKPPLAAIVQRGLGKVAAIAMPPTPELLDRLLAEISPPPGDRRFTLQAKPNGEGAWRITARGSEGEHFLDAEHLSAHLLTADNGSEDVALVQTAPGTYEAVVNVPAVWAATVTAGDGRLIGQLRPAMVEAGEWPASVDAVWKPAAGVVRLSARGDERWHPPASASRSIAPACWMAAALLGLVALFVRR